jgi:hypothetical protein
VRRYSTSATKYVSLSYLTDRRVLITSALELIGKRLNANEVAVAPPAL